MAYDWRDALRRKLPHDLGSGFPRLPLLCRLFFLSLLDECDGEGRIRVGAGAPAEALAAMLGAHVGERRLVRGYVPQLIAAGLLRHEGAFVTLKPAVAEATGGTNATNGTSETNKTNETSFTNTDATTRKDTASHSKQPDAIANERNEPATSEGVTPQNDSPSTVKPAESAENTVPPLPPSSLPASNSTPPISLPSSPSSPAGGVASTQSVPPTGVPPARQGGLFGEEPGAPAAPKKPRARSADAPEPLPFKLGEALDALVSAAAGRVVRGEGRDITKPIAIALNAQIRTYPTLAEWSLVGAWLADGALAHRGTLGPSWVASAAFREAMALARDWAAKNRPAANAPAPRVDGRHRPQPAPSRTSPVRRGAAPVSESFDDDGPDPYAARTTQRANATPSPHGERP